MKRQRPADDSAKRSPSPQLKVSSVTSLLTAGKKKANNNNNQQKNDHNNGNSEAQHNLLTPHTLRLLKLIQDGSREHAAMAALQLATITAQSSPLVLWDVLGRLQTLLVAARRWQSRANASCAMQGVARHVPPKARQQFMESVLEQQQQQEETSTASHATTQPKKEYLWLTLSDIQNECDAILQKGRLLWAYADERDQDAATLQEEDYLRHLDQQQLQGSGATAESNDKEDDDDRKAFVQRRIQWQRRILAQRVGLSGLMQATGLNNSGADTCLSSAITAEDLDYHPTTTTLPRSEDASTTTKPKRKTKRRRRRGTAKDDEDDTLDEQSKEFINAQSVRALLVLEMKREQTSLSDSTSTASSLSHDNPQKLLATELLYRVFDPSWYVRHGALLGLLSLLRAWHTTTTTTKSNKKKFGAWPQDILARCLCVLVLDRFGDYSGTTTATVGSGGSESGCVVAPVRETAGQLLSMVWLLAPFDVQEETLQLLYQLAKGRAKSTATGEIEERNSGDDDRSMDWEIRHGALLALKYIVAVQIASKSCNDKAPPTSYLSDITKVATECLADESDDVHSVAAQILSTLLAASHALDFNFNREWAFEQLCQALARTRSMSSSILDLMNLCSTMLRHQDDTNMIFLGRDGIGDGLTGASILDIFGEYLDHDLMSVRLAALRSISNVVEPLWKAQINGDCASVVDALDRLLERTFVSYLHDGATGTLASSQLKGKEADKETNDTAVFKSFKACRSQAWVSLVNVLRDRINHDQHRKSFESAASRLILNYFGISQSGQAKVSLLNPRQDLFPAMLSAADALSDILWASNENTHSTKNTNTSEIHLLELAINTFLHSPWTVKCEAACLLLRALMKRVGSVQRGDNRNGPLLRVLTCCRQSVIRVLSTESTAIAPLCLAAEYGYGDALQDPGVLQLRDSAFLSGLELLQTSRTSTRIDDAATGIRELWKTTILLTKEGSDGVPTTTMGKVAATPSSMRLFAIMAGVSLAGSNGVFPSKKATPIIRPIMTSLRNETDGIRLTQTSEYMVELLSILFADGAGSGDLSLSPLLRAREKILNTMCEAVSSCNVVESEMVFAFGRVTQKFVNVMSGQFDSLECIPPIWLRLQPLLKNYQDCDQADISRALNILEVVCGDLRQDGSLTARVISDFLPPATVLACQHGDANIRDKCTRIIQSMCSAHTKSSLPATLPVISGYLEDRKNDSYRISSCQLLASIIHEVGMEICPFVRRLLRIVMSLMADPVPSCAKTANSIFACLVRVAPLVRCDDTGTKSSPKNGTYKADSVVDHLIHGRPLPPYTLPNEVSASLRKGGVSMRPYQMEGVAWLRFLQSVNLNGALCDSMGLGKTLQALVGAAIAHVEAGKDPNHEPKSLVVCPSSVVGHWEAEIEKFFPEKLFFRSLAYVGAGEERKALWKRYFMKCNIVVTSYSSLRSDADTLSKPMWRFVILDEGHLLKNPKTATARASRRLRAHHKLILTGTPVQNKVQEVFATFDFLMPNFLGSSQSFAKEFARPITKSHLPGATAETINNGMDKLKVLHQQVLPFILRREKSHVLKELPPKCISTVPCEMSSRQRTLYEGFLATQDAKQSVVELQRALQQSSASDATTPETKLGSKALKTLLFLRLLCTHPSLVERDSAGPNSSAPQRSDAYDIGLSGKFLALIELLRACGIHKDEITGADNDTSLLYCNEDEQDEDDESDISNLLDPIESDGLLNSAPSDKDSGSKCLLFAQFTHSLDAVEELLVKRHMPSLRYLRLDGRVPVTKRTALVDAFNTDPSIKLMLLTTRVGGLGLNLTGADTVIFLENDFNPFADLQAADRAHRIGQAKTVNIYKLVTKDSIEEKIMSLQEKKIALSNAIVNTDNSSLFSLGTDRLLDIFTCRSDNQKNEAAQSGGDGSYNLDALVESYKSEYEALSVDDFLQALQK